MTQATKAIPKNKPGTYPAPSPAHWNWCSRCGCSVDDDMLTGEFRDGSEGTCIGCGTVYVAVALTDGSWAFHEREDDEEHEDDDSDEHEVARPVAEEPPHFPALKFWPREGYARDDDGYRVAIGRRGRVAVAFRHTDAGWQRMDANASAPFLKRAAIDVLRQADAERGRADALCAAVVAFVRDYERADESTRAERVEALRKLVEAQVEAQLAEPTKDQEVSDA